MDDIKTLEAVEKYIRGEMNPDERMYFENLRKTNPEIEGWQPLLLLLPA